MDLRRRRIIPQAAPVIDDTKLVEILTRLKDIASHSLSTVSIEQRKDLEELKRLAVTSYKIPEYDAISAKVAEVFSTGQPPEPYSVEAFVIGAEIHSNLTTVLPDVNQGCSLLFCNGLPSASKTWSFCSQNVIWCVPHRSVIARNARPSSVHGKGGVFDFIYMSRVPTSTKAILFLDDSFPFSGFTPGDKRRLSQVMHIANVKLVSYAYVDNKIVYKDLLGKTSTVQNLKTSSVPQKAKKSVRFAEPMTKVATYTFGWRQIAGIFLLIVLLIGLITLYIINSRRQRPKRRRG